MFMHRVVRSAILVAAAVAAATVATPAVNASQAPIAYISGEGGSVSSYGPTNSRTGTYFEGGSGYPIVEQVAFSDSALGSFTATELNTRHRDKEELRHHLCAPGSTRCLLFQGYSGSSVNCGATAGCPNDRLEVTLSHQSSPEALRFDEWRVLRFDLNVHPDSTVGPQRAIISQTWQPDRGIAFGVFLRRHADPDLIWIDFMYHNDNHAPGQSTTFESQAIEKGDWHNFTIRMKPRHVNMPGGRGVILVWKDTAVADLITTNALNYSTTDDTSYKFHWGYEPNTTNGVDERFEIRVGMYRPAPVEYLTFWMDEIILAETVSALDLP